MLALKSAVVAQKNNKSYTKPIAISTARSDHDLTVKKVKALNAVYWAARQAFFTRNPHFLSMKKESITLEKVRKSDTTIHIEDNLMLQAMGYCKEKYNSYTQVKKTLLEISNHKVFFDSLGIAIQEDETDNWTDFSNLISTVTRENGNFVIEIPSYIMYRLIAPNPKTSFETPLNLGDISSKFAFPILDICLYCHQNQQTTSPWVSTDKIRALFNLTSDYYKDYKRLNSKCLKPAIENINNSSQLPFTIELETSTHRHNENGDIIKQPTSNSRKKPIQEVRFIIRKKSIDLLPKVNIQFENELSIQKSEMRALGIAKNQIDTVIDECRDDANNIMLEYIVWCNRRGYELKSIQRFADLDNNEFGGLFRKKVIRTNKENWMQTNTMLNTYLKERHSITPDKPNFKYEKLLLNEKVKKQVIINHLKNISDFALDSMKSSFIKWIEIEKPDMFDETTTDCEQFSLSELPTESHCNLVMFLREEYNLFTPTAYSIALNEL